jgi:hypothetical protein
VLLLTLTSAAPTLERRSCQYTYPASLCQLTPSGAPVDPEVTDFCVSISRVQYASFGALSAGAPGPCQLEFVFPAAYDIAGAGSHAVNVWKIDRPVQEGDSWKTALKPVTLFRTVTLSSEKKNRKKIVVNSGVYEEMSNFEFTFAHHGYGKGNVGRRRWCFSKAI